MAWSKRSQVLEAINLTISSVRTYLFNTRLPVTYSHPSIPSSKSSTLHISRLDSASCPHCLAFCIFSEKSPFWAMLTQQWAGKIGAPLVWVCPIDTLCRAAPGPQQAFQSTVTARITQHPSLKLSWVQLKYIQYMFSFHNSSHNSCSLKVHCYPPTKPWVWPQHGLDLFCLC